MREIIENANNNNNNRSRIIDNSNKMNDSHLKNIGRRSLQGGAIGHLKQCAFQLPFLVSVFSSTTDRLQVLRFTWSNFAHQIKKHLILYKSTLYVEKSFLINKVNMYLSIIIKQLERIKLQLIENSSIGISFIYQNST